MERFRQFGFRVSRSNRRTGWVLKCDIRKFFASIDQNVLLGILSLYIPDEDIMWLLKKIIGSFYSTEPGKGLPLGNLTSQLLVNIYMNELDQHVKHKLKAKYYIRYADDFVFFSDDRAWLEVLIPEVECFLTEILQLKLHPDKVFIRSLAHGVDFLGWVHFPDHCVLRTAMARRIKRRLADDPQLATVQSYLGVLKHGNTQRLVAKIGC